MEHIARTHRAGGLTRCSQRGGQLSSGGGAVSDNGVDKLAWLKDAVRSQRAAHVRGVAVRKEEPFKTVEPIKTEAWQEQGFKLRGACTIQQPRFSPDIQQ